MFGIAIVLTFLFYLVVTFVLVLLVSRSARKRGKKGWKWGLPAAICMYLLVFWDHIPTLVLHDYYCSTEAGFWMHVTPEQWVLENPGVIKTLKESLAPKFSSADTWKNETGTIQRFWATQRFYKEIRRKQIFASLGLTEKRFVDATTGKLIANSLSYYRGVGSKGIGRVRDDVLFSMGNRECVVDGKSLTDEFTHYTYKFWKYGEGK